MLVEVGDKVFNLICRSVNILHLVENYCQYSFASVSFVSLFMLLATYAYNHLNKKWVYFMVKAKRTI